MADYISKINTFLADQLVFFVKLHNLHWYIKGSGFFTLHSQYENLYDEAAEVLDAVAERLLQLEAFPVASLKEASALSGISEREAKPVDSKESVEILLEDYTKLRTDVADIVKLAAEAGDDGTADLFTGYLNSYSKLIWMLKAYLK